MTSVMGLPTKGSDVTILITKVHFHPHCVFVEFWGKFKQEETADYDGLAKDIQSPGDIFQEFEGNAGDQCLVQIDGIWYRSRIVSRHGSKYSMFLIDKGTTFKTSSSKLAWGKKHYFNLLPEVEFCVLANVLPQSSENRWCPWAFEFLRSLPGKSVKAHVQDVMPHRTFLLHIPCISEHMYGIRIAKKLSPVAFLEFVLKSLQPHSGAKTPPGDELTSVGESERLHKKEHFMHPELQAGTVETVKVTDVTNPQYPPQQDGFQSKMSRKEEGQKTAERLPAEDLSLHSSHEAVVQHVSDPSEFWIQTQNFANELDELMDGIYHLYKDSVGTDVKNAAVGLYCAAQAKDGDFYRATVTEVGETKLKVFFLDYGNTEYVDRDDIRVLPDKFKKLPRLALKCSLASVRPNGQKWSPSACEFFIKATADKILKINVTAKNEDCYVVLLVDPEAQGEGDLSSLICQSGHAEKAETQRQSTAKPPIQAAPLPTAQLPDARLSGPHIHHGTSWQLRGAGAVDANQRRTPTFKEYMFPIGSVLDVAVSFIESPNDFWCRLAQNSGLLKLLMHDIQAYYKDSKSQFPIETTCVARHPDGMWYRALLIHKHESQVTVFFVDYGQTQTVSLYDLRRICSRFLSLHAQAFRCSLFSPLHPTTATNEWNEEAVAKFFNFVKTAASNRVILRCTIYAVMYREQKVIFNVVDLETPFERIAASMASQPKSAVSKKTAGPLFHLDTYYYSTHDVKIGTEERVTVTCVNNVSQFYCQLERNADVINDLRVKVNSLCDQLEKTKLSTVFGTLCFAKHTDGQWYRGQIKSTKPEIIVQFVDRGDSTGVEESDLLPVPSEASDIMSIPVQALVCSLSDVPADVPREMNNWFEERVADFTFEALVIAREPDGKLQVELYHGNTQINSKIKKMFKIEKQPDSVVVHQSLRAPGLSGYQTPRGLKAAPKQVEEKETQTIRHNTSTSKAACRSKDADKNPRPEPGPSQNLDENRQKVKAAPLKLYQPPHRRV